MSDPYPPGFANWPEDRKNAFFAKAAADYRATHNGAAAFAKLKVKAGSSEPLEGERGNIFIGNARSEPPPPDGPLPLFPPLAEAEPYPADALGKTLTRAATAIASKAQVPIAMAAQSVLAVASLAASSHADVQLPFGQVRPLSLFFATVAASGDRKSTADNEALWPVAKREKTLREAYADELKEWRIDFAAWLAEKIFGAAAKIILDRIAPVRRDVLFLSTSP